MPPHQDLALPTSPGALQGSGSLGVSSLKNDIYLFISTTFQSFAQVWLRACSAAAHCAGLREAWRWCVSALLPFFGRGLLWLVSLPTLLCTLPLPLTHQYSDHLHAQDQLCTRPISIRKLLKLHSKTSTTKADSNLDDHPISTEVQHQELQICRSGRFLCRRCLSGVWEETTTAFIPSTTWSTKHLSTRDQPHRAARCHNFHLDYLMVRGHLQLSPWWPFCSWGCVWSGNGLGTCWGFLWLGSGGPALPLLLQVLLCWAPCVVSLQVWGCSLAN